MLDPKLLSSEIMLAAEQMLQLADGIRRALDEENTDSARMFLAMYLALDKKLAKTKADLARSLDC